MGSYVLENDIIKATINSYGAELRSLIRKLDDRELMWCGDKKYWGRVSPVLFPFIGKLEGLSYRHQGKVYENIPQHGFARDTEFELVEQTEDTLWFEMSRDEKWDINYPFEFKLRLGYKVEGNSLHVMWTVVNTGQDALHFSIGAHPAFACEGGLKGYSLDFNVPKDKLTSGVLAEAGVLGKEECEVILENGVLKLSDELFDADALILDGHGINKVDLLDVNGAALVSVKFDTPQLGIWSPAKAGAPFVCIEPWYGRCDRQGFDGDLSQREYGNTIEAGHSFSKEYVIEVK